MKSLSFIVLLACHTTYSQDVGIGQSNSEMKLKVRTTDNASRLKRGYLGKGDVLTLNATGTTTGITIPKLTTSLLITQYSLLHPHTGKSQLS